MGTAMQLRFFKEYTEYAASATVGKTMHKTDEAVAVVDIVNGQACAGIFVKLGTDFSVLCCYHKISGP